MHIFCDESGGASPANRQFTLTSVVVDPIAAGRTVRTFRKRWKGRGEVKGTDLTPDERINFIQLLQRDDSIRGAAVICARGQAVANWAMTEFSGNNEATLYRHLLVESLKALEINPAVRGITADQSRYKRVISERIAGEVISDLEKRTGRRLLFEYGVSGSSPGLQVADVLCNTAGQLGSDLGEVAEIALKPLRTAGLLIVQEASLPELVPSWLAAQLAEQSG